MNDQSLDENVLSRHIIECAIEVHRRLRGPGLPVGVYMEALVEALMRRGLDVRRQVGLPIRYKGIRLASWLCVDLIVGNLVIVECKATSKYNPVFEGQTLSLLRQTGLRLGLVVNFGECDVKDAMHRVVNGLQA